MFDFALVILIFSVSDSFLDIVDSDPTLERNPDPGFEEKKSGSRAAIGGKFGSGSDFGVICCYGSDI